MKNYKYPMQGYFVIIRFTLVCFFFIPGERCSPMACQHRPCWTKLWAQLRLFVDQLDASSVNNTQQRCLSLLAR
jgi:hypothetical protein